MTAEAVVHQEPLLVVIFVQKNVGVCGAVWSSRPIRIFLAVALGAAPSDLEHILGFQPDLLRHLTTQVRDQLPHILQVKTCVEGEYVAVTLGTCNVAMSRFVPVAERLPNFVAARARSAA